MKLKRLLFFVVALALVWNAELWAKTYNGIKLTARKVAKITPKNTKPTNVVDEDKTPPRVGPNVDSFFQKFISGTKDPARVPADHVPKVTGALLPLPVSGFATSFDGINHLTQRTGGVLISGFTTQFSKEPNDNTLSVGGTTQCSGGPCVVEVVNTLLRAYSTAGATIATRSMHQQFARTPNYEFDRSRAACFTAAGAALCNGEFLSDPQVYFDTATSRWFITVLEIETNDFTGNFLNETAVLIAVSTSADPNGAYNIYKIDTDNDGTDGTPNHPSCPCFPDQPLLGANQHAIFISANEFGLNGGFNGAQVYALDKAALAAGAGTINMQLFSPGALAEGISYSVYPAITPVGATPESALNGTEFFLSTLDFFDTLDNRLAVWAATNTATIGSTPNIKLVSKIVGTQVYGAPPRNEQPDGSHPLLDCLNTPTCAGPFLFGIPSFNLNEHLPLVDSGGDRMRQTYYTGVGGSSHQNKVWGSLTTVVKTQNTPPRPGVFFFAFTPTLTGTATAPILNASPAKQGYVAVNGQGTHYPAVAVNSAGKGVLAFSVTGRQMYPSAGFATVSIASGAGPVRLAGLASKPFDGFSGYGIFNLPSATRPRWGDYSGASIDAGGNAFIVSGFIDPPNTLNVTRNITANWGSRISKILLP